MATRRKKPRTPHWGELDRNGNKLRPGDKVRIVVKHGELYTGTPIWGTARGTVVVSNDLHMGVPNLGIKVRSKVYAPIPASAELIERAIYRSPRVRKTRRPSAVKRRRTLRRKPARNR